MQQRGALQEHASREKVANEMKKDLKKLQRLRDQVRGWAQVATPAVDQRLLDSRQAIELEMERCALKQTSLLPMKTILSKLY